jgi:hypothetical protein
MQGIWTCYQIAYYILKGWKIFWTRTLIYSAEDHILGHIRSKYSYRTCSTLNVNVCDAVYWHNAQLSNPWINFGVPCWNFVINISKTNMLEDKEWDGTLELEWMLLFHNLMANRHRKWGKCICFSHITLLDVFMNCLYLNFISEDTVIHNPKFTHKHIHVHTGRYNS